MSPLGDDVTPFPPPRDREAGARRLDMGETPRRLATAVVPTLPTTPPLHRETLRRRFALVSPTEDAGVVSTAPPLPLHRGEGATATTPLVVEDTPLPSHTPPPASPSLADIEADSRTRPLQSLEGVGSPDVSLLPVRSPVDTDVLSTPDLYGEGVAEISGGTPRS